MVLMPSWSWRSHGLPPPLNHGLCLLWASARSSALQRCVQKWFILRREANMLSHLIGEVTYREEEEQGASGRARPTGGGL